MIEAVKSYLKITWDVEDDHLAGIIQRGKAELQDLTGTELDFETESPARSLLFDYCRYAYNNALEYFQENFKREILKLQLKSAVNQSEE